LVNDQRDAKLFSVDLFLFLTLYSKNKYTEKNCPSRWSFTKNHYMMHGQQNIKNHGMNIRYFLKMWETSKITLRNKLRGNDSWRTLLSLSLSLSLFHLKL
jgi:hypothetical protein